MSYSTKVKIRIKETKHFVSDKAHTCILTIGPKWSDDFITLAVAARDLGVIGEKRFGEINSSWDFTGVARYKDGDVKDSKLARTVAFEKAYRLALKHYYRDYNEVVEKMKDYLEKVALKWVEDLRVREEKHDQKLRSLG